MKQPASVSQVLEGEIKPYLLKHSLIIFIGLLCMSTLSLVDVYFIGKIGSDALTAISYTTPVFLFGLSILLSLGTGIAAIVSQAIGKQHIQEPKELTVSSFFLSLVVGLILFAVGFLGHEAVFNFMKAAPEFKFLLNDYMHIVYPGFIVLSVLMAVLSVIRSYGDTRIPTVVMVLIVLLNIILDPLLIFGYGPIPAMEFKGAALATVIALSAGLLVAIISLPFYVKLKLSDWKKPFYKWVDILYIALPVSVTRTLMPFAMSVLTRLLAPFGSETVAAFGIAYRLDVSVLMFMIALSSVITPFIGQNFGAKNFPRIQKVLKVGFQFAFIYALIISLVFFIFRNKIGLLFTDDQSVIKVLAFYYLIIPIGFFFNGVLIIATASLNVLNKPIPAALISVVHLGAVYLPICFLGKHLLTLSILFWAYPISHFIMAGISWYSLSYYLKKEMN